MSEIEQAPVLEWLIPWQPVTDASALQLQLTVVHLTYTRTPPDRPPYPDTEMFESMARFVERMKSDHEDFTTEVSW